MKNKTNTQKIIIEKGKEIYYKIKPQLEKKYDPGYYVTVEINSGKFFVGKNPVDALTKAQKSFPHKTFYLTQIGRAAGMLK